MAMEEEDDAGGIPEWVVTFGDMMSLLLTFFIMLFSMSEMREEERYQAILEALHQRFGYDSTQNSSIPGKDIKPRSTAMAKQASPGRARRANTMNGGDRVKAPVGEHKQVVTVRPGKERTVGGVVYFDPLTADLSEENKDHLKAIKKEISGKMLRIDIRGHTTNQRLPKNSPYRDNWHLAYERARNVSDYLIHLGIDPKRIRLSVSANNEPIDTTNYRKNARVEISTLDELTRPTQKNSSDFSSEISYPTTP